MAIAVDKRALKILSNTHWSTAGWKRQPETPADDFSYAKAAGLMFDPVHVTHDQAIDWAIRSKICSNSPPAVWHNLHTSASGRGARRPGSRARQRGKRKLPASKFHSYKADNTHQNTDAAGKHGPNQEEYSAVGVSCALGQPRQAEQNQASSNEQRPQPNHAIDAGDERTPVALAEPSSFEKFILLFGRAHNAYSVYSCNRKFHCRRLEAGFCLTLPAHTPP